MFRSNTVVIYLLLWAGLSFSGLTSPVFGDGGFECKLITFDQDTIHGYIKKSSRNNFYERIKFRTEDQKKFSIYTPEEIQSVISSELMLNSYRININNVDKYIFIRKAYEGKIDFYYSKIDNNSDLVNDDEKVYFVGLEGNRIIQLRKRRLVETLMVLFQECDEIMEQIDKTRFDYYYYNYKKLYKLVTSYDSCSRIPEGPENREKAPCTGKVMYSIQ